MTRLPALVADIRIRRRLGPRIGRAASILAVVALFTGCEGGSGQSGSAFVFLTVNGFFVAPATAPGSSTVNSSVATGTTTTACVVLQNNLKNPTVTASTALDNVLIQSYTLTLTLATGATLTGPLTFGASALIPAGTPANGTGAPGPNTGTLAVVVVPSNVKSGIAPGTVATALFRFRGRDGRGNSVEAEGAVTVVFVAASVPDSSCGGTTTPPATP